MGKIDRLGWTAGISFRAYGVRVGLRVNDKEALDQVADHLPPGWKPATSPVVERLYSFKVGGEGPRANIRRFNLLYANDAKVGRSLDLAHMMKLFESDLQLFVAESAPRRVFVHAGVVGWKGRAILIPGRSFSGKTSLVVELVRAGATYYSDEYAVLDTRGRVHPYPRKLWIREKDSLESERWSAESLGGSFGVKPLPVGVVVITRYKAGARWRPARVTSGRGALALLDNAISIQRRPELAFPVLGQVAAEATILKGVRGEARDTVDSILKSLDDVVVLSK
jgi:hypothetical protein